MTHEAQAQRLIDAGPAQAGAAALLSDPKSLIERAQDITTQAVNRDLTMLYWLVERRIQEDVLARARAYCRAGLRRWTAFGATG
ncbi:MAG TPA: hypothetical protein VGM81_10690 [Burkholderiaceae bacterium]|jgi:hypothetical protein